MPRPAPRRLLITLALVVLLIAAAVPVVSAVDDLSAEIGEDDYYVASYTSGHGGGIVTPYWDDFDAVMIYQPAKDKLLRASSPIGIYHTSSSSRSVTVTNRSILSASVPVAFRADGQIYGTGVLSYVGTPIEGAPENIRYVVTIDFGTFSYSESVASKQFTLEYDTEAFNNFMYKKSPITTYPGAGETSAIIEPGHGAITTSTVLVSPWKQTLTCNYYSGTYDKIAIYRNGLRSNLNVKGINEYALIDQLGDTDYNKNVLKTKRPYTADVYRYGKHYPVVFYGDVEPTDPEGDTFAFSVSEPINIGQPVTVNLSGPIDTARLIFYRWGDAEYFTGDGGTGSGSYVMLESVNDTWYQRDENDEPTIPIADPTTWQFPGPTSSGQYKFLGMVKAPSGEILKLQELYRTVGLSSGYEFILPVSARAGMGSTVWLQCSDTELAKASIITYKLTDSENTYSKTIAFKKIDNVWFKKDENGQFTIPSDSPREGTFPPHPKPDIYRFDGAVIAPNGGYIYQQTGELVVSGVDVEKSLLTIYIQNAQTGALLADAHVKISAATGYPLDYYEVVNRSVSGGVFGIDLQPTGGGMPNPEYYRVEVTADGYVPQLPYLDIDLPAGVPTSITFGLDPIAGGPENETKTFVDFYVRDLNGNGIRDATVKFDRYTLMTNSAGYAVFEVPKNATYAWQVKKPGYTTLEGRAVIGDNPRHTINTVISVGTVPTYTPTPGPGETPGGPGATPTPDHRTNEQKGQAVIDMIADNAEGIGALALICLLLGLLKLMVKW